MNYNTYTLPNGLRIIHLESDSPVVYCGYAIAAGTRHEQADQFGIAHFCEHMTFKGTERLTPMKVINTLEQYGGDLNAFTTKEDTFYYATILREHFNKAVDLLTEIVFHSTYPQHEIDKEVEVICDEIESYNDTPADLIYDEFENIIFHSTSLGHNILGDADHVRQFTTADAQRFTKEHYTPQNCVFYVMGDVSMKKLIKQLTLLTESLTFSEREKPKPELFDLSKVPTKAIVKNIGSHQAHVIIGAMIPKTASHALFLLNNILGGPSMSSRFNLALREKRGLVYSVDSTITTYSDTYLWTTYLGCDPHDVNRCLRIIEKVKDRLRLKPLSPKELQRAKQQFKGQLTLAAENRENFAIDMAKQYLHRGTLKDNAELFSRIDAITSDDIQRIASEYLAPERLVTLVMK